MKQPNLSYIEKLANGDDKFSKSLIDIIKLELPNEIDLYWYHIKNNNLKKAASDVHKIKHKMSILSYKDGYKLAIKHENNLRIDKNIYQEQFDQVLKILTNYIQLI